MDGMRGYRGWRWVFILGKIQMMEYSVFLSGLTSVTEGALTCLVGFLLYFLISDFPEEAKWLTPEERNHVKARLRADVGASQRLKRLKAQDVLNVVSECKQ